MLAPALVPTGSTLRRALAASAALHAGVALLLLLHPAAGELPDDVPPIEVELVQQAAQDRGAEPVRPSAPAPPRAPAPAGSTPSTTATPPSRPTQSAQPASPPEVNLGGGAEDVDPLTVTGEHVIPPAPDSAYRNLPPPYPAEAARIGAEGTVQLLIHVTAAGRPETVVVAMSSGHQSLDEAARRALLQWRFRPARAGGQKLPFDYLINIRFKLGDQP